jgi:hypothetical protein
MYAIILNVVTFLRYNKYGIPEMCSTSVFRGLVAIPLTFQVPSLISIFFRGGLLSKESVQVHGLC